MTIDADGWYSGASRYPSARVSAMETPGGTPLGLVWHWTGGRGGAEPLARSIQLRGNGAQASWHFLIVRDGRILQSVSTLDASWHVGRPGVIAGKKFANVNRATVGVELENTGRAIRVGSAFRSVENPHAPRGSWIPSQFVLPAGEVQAVGDELFHAFPLPQIAAAEALLREMVLRFGWTRGVCSYGHRDFDPSRKADPGDLWSHVVLPQILDRIFPTTGGAA